MHLDLEHLQRLVHGELSPAGERSAREHLAVCAECRAGAADLERQEAEVHALLRQVDHVVPAVDVRTIVARARARRAGWLRWAAVTLVSLGLAGAAWAAPGSPLKAWAEAVTAWIRGTPEVTEPSVAGIAVAPGSDLLVLFTSTQTAGTVRVSLSDSADVVVRAPVGAASYSTEADRLVIDNRGSQASFEVHVPRAAPRVEIRVAGVRRFLKEDSVVTGPTVVPLTPYMLIPLTP
jgi:anti-sigma factor RsiW